ncbi:MAG TPA: cytochrome c3 family protein [Planctomycetota bacterium]|nr:cytochrome c3 family protein [Planctomycetota bacterium]
MPALFRRTANGWFRVALGGGTSAVAGTIAFLLVWVRMPPVTGQYAPYDQPVKFDHRHHVKDDGIDCRYCHVTAERSPFAGVPASSVCMGCHSQVWPTSPLLEPVRQSALTGKPIPWVRVHRLPDFVFFNHSVHLAKGVGCVQCHGAVDEMAQVYQVAPLTMGWCLACHRDPAPHVMPRSEITSMRWEPGSRVEQEARAREYGVRRLTDCTTCHR